ncbi:MAG TPA: adenosylcobinamide-phosphate synthase CbiB [Geminicoccus sp.]|uniref:adenosylcobinamide-phosphate synthase CbiB n=1 Tax=Geminicoccus sp. TaxID=2024832 RepID=UPI002D095F25|nr:adenosylcobinamide-phosphate synthase CbiB [Geminicoccus sp.]HWL67241.1 adenosylcobinamide-phosphate synthase CbiB [Geminicoccus sp.]
MLVEPPAHLLAWLILALVLDALIGDPPALWRRLPHPVVLIGRLVTMLEHLLLDAPAPNEHAPGDRMPDERAANAARRRRRGILLVLLVLALALTAGAALQALAGQLPGGWLLEAAAAATLFAQRSLSDHVLAVARGMDEGIEAARRKVAMIVGRDPDQLDQPAVGRAAIESAAENFSDGLVAPLVWTLLLGLPGLLAYKAVNTMDSMIGHKSQRYRHFGWAAARLDDLVNLPASRLSALLAILAACILPGASPIRAWRTVRRDARQHRSPNAGWPEAAFAGALGIALCGPRSYGGVPSVAHWIGDGRRDVTAVDVRRAIRLLWLAWLIALGILLFVFLALPTGGGTG